MILFFIKCWQPLTTWHQCKKWSLAITASFHVHKSAAWKWLEQLINRKEVNLPHHSHKFKSNVKIQTLQFRERVAMTVITSMCHSNPLKCQVKYFSDQAFDKYTINIITQQWCESYFFTRQGLVLQIIEEEHVSFFVCDQLPIKLLKKRKEKKSQEAKNYSPLSINRCKRKHAV